MEFRYLNYRFEFHSYVNGVALLANRVSKGKTLFWDPSVRRFVFVPHFGPMRYGIGGGFDEEVVYRLGFDRLNNDYKILAVFYSEEGSFTSEQFRRAFYDSSDERDDGTLFEYEGDLCSDDDDVLCRDDGSCGNSGDGLRNYSWDSLSDVGCDSLVCGRVDASGDHGAPFSVVEIYSLNSWTWKNVSTSNLSLRPLHPQVFVYDAIHWTGSKGRRRLNDGEFEQDGVVSFDMKTEVFNRFLLPKRSYHVGKIICTKLVAFGESVALLDHLQERCYLWVMEEHGVSKTWTRKYSIDVVMKSLLGFKENGEVLYSNHENEVSTYDIVSHRIRHFSKIDEEFGVFVGPYVENLVLLPGDEEYGEPRRKGNLLMLGMPQNSANYRIT